MPPGALPALTDPAVPLWITEGSRKADAAVTAGLCCIALLGVDGWQRDRVALPDWKDVRVKDRDVYVAYDSDVMTKDAVAGALTRFTGWLEYRDARVRHVILPPGDGGRKTGLDDYLAAGHSTDEAYALARAPGSVSGVSSVLPWSALIRLIRQIPQIRLRRRKTARSCWTRYRSS